MKTFKIAAIAIGATLLLAGCSAPHLPPKKATVVDVTKAYATAAISKDCATTKALTEHTFAWCSNPHMIKYKIIGPAYVSPSQRNVPTQTCVPMELTSKGTDEDVAFDGTHRWDFCFVQTDNGWRLWDQGQG